MMILAIGVGGLVLMMILVGFITFRQVSGFMAKIRADEEQHRKEEEEEERAAAEKRSGETDESGGCNDHDDIAESEH